MLSWLRFLWGFLFSILSYPGKLFCFLKRTSAPVSVNYHFTRQCNYKCGFCFHTATTSHLVDEEDWKRGLTLLKDAGMRKINFSGGEPFLQATMLGHMCKYAKEELKLESVSIVSNGSKITENWMKEYGKFVDILAISCDSFDEDTNIKIGRGTGKHLQSLQQVAQWCKREGIKFKINTVVNRFNFKEDMGVNIANLAPVRWKVFQVLSVDGENHGEKSLRDVSSFLISSGEYQQFIDQHSNRNLPLVPEDNKQMRASYLILDEYMRFLDCSTGGKKPSEPILVVGVAAALKQSGWDSTMFKNRGGYYKWSREPLTGSSPCSSNGQDIEDIASAKKRS